MKDAEKDIDLQWLVATEDFVSALKEHELPEDLRSVHRHFVKGLRVHLKRRGVVIEDA